MHLWEARILDGLASRHQVTAPSSPQLTLVLETSGLLLHHHRRLCLAAEKLLRSMVSKLGENYAKPVTYNPKLEQGENQPYFPIAQTVAIPVAHLVEDIEEDNTSQDGESSCFGR